MKNRVLNIYNKTEQLIKFIQQLIDSLKRQQMFHYCSNRSSGQSESFTFS